MVPLSESERRHRLQPEEIPAVLEALAMLLRVRVRAGEDLAGTIPAFRAFYRLMEHRPGRPNYPEPVTWNTIAEWVEWYHLIIAKSRGVEG